MNVSLDQKTIGTGVPEILARLLHDARRCILTLHRDKNENALHDFRVSIRRLRVWCKVVGDDALACVPKSYNKKLKNLVSLTNKTRDLDVHIELLKESSDKFSISLQNAVAKVEGKWRKNSLASRKKVVREIGKLFPKIDEACVEIISEIAGSKAQELKLSFWIGSVFSRYGKKLDALINGIESVQDEEKIHKARLCAKALRYLVEPFTHENADAQALVDSLRRLQDLIGSLRDMQTLVQHIESSKHADLLAPLLKRGHTRKTALFKKFQKECLKGVDFQNKAQLLFATVVEQP